MYWPQSPWASNEEIKEMPSDEEARRRCRAMPPLLMGPDHASKTRDRKSSRGRSFRADSRREVRRVVCGSRSFGNGCANEKHVRTSFERGSFLAVVECESEFSAPNSPLHSEHHPT